MPAQPLVKITEKAIVGDGSGQALWTDPAVFEPQKYFLVSVQGTFTSGKLRLQKSYDAGATWVNQIDDGEFTTTLERECHNADGAVQWRVGSLAGDNFNGSVTLRLRQS